GQTNVPVNLTNVLAISSGGQSLFNLALSANGTVQGWGNNSSGQTNVPATLTNVTAIAAGSSFGLAIGSQAPFVNNITASGFLNHDLAFALSGGDPDGNPLSFYVTSLPAAGVLYQSSNGSCGPAITTPNTLVTDPSAQLIFAPANGGGGSPYASFSFMANDTIYNSATAQATINVGLPAVPQFGNVLWDSANENFTLDFSGSSNATYSLWSSTNLFNWTDLGTATEAEPGLYQFIDSSVTNSPQCFYRLSAP
ncbi:MAG TPA: RCC1 domain-containing protein, partial [Verrucomicrobiae bacterium]